MYGQLLLPGVRQGSDLGVLLTEGPHFFCLFTENPGISPAARRCACRREEAAAGGAHYRVPRGGCKGARGDGGPGPAGAGGGGECALSSVLLPAGWPSTAVMQAVKHWLWCRGVTQQLWL